MEGVEESHDIGRRGLSRAEGVDEEPRHGEEDGQSDLASDLLRRADQSRCDPPSSPFFILEVAPILNYEGLKPLGSELV
jgi:hypothetical protein